MLMMIWKMMARFEGRQILKSGSMATICYVFIMDHSYYSDAWISSCQKKLLVMANLAVISIYSAA